MERTSVPIERKLELTRYLREKSHYNHQEMKRQEQILYGEYPFLEEAEKPQHVPYWQIRLLISSIILGVLLYCHYANLSIGYLTYEMVDSAIQENINLNAFSADILKKYKLDTFFDIKVMN